MLSVLPIDWANHPPGTRDLIGGLAQLRRQVEDALLRFFADHGYEMVSCGPYEYVDTLQRARPAGGPQTWVQWFDAAGRAVALRPDMTPSIARMAAPLLQHGQSDLRWCYAERVYQRATDPASLSWVSGRAAESTQVGVEHIDPGAPRAQADLDLLLLCRGALQQLAIRDWQLVVSHARFAPAFLTWCGASAELSERLLDRLAQGDYVGFREIASAASAASVASVASVATVPEATAPEATAPDAGRRDDWLSWLVRLNPYHPASLQKLPGYSRTGTDARLVDMRVAWEELCALAAAVTAEGCADSVSFDLTLHRDAGYYTGFVFELFCPAVGAPVAQGGRYDDLLAQFGAPAAAVGFTFEIERLLGVLTEGDKVPGQSREERGC